MLHVVVADEHVGPVDGAPGRQDEQTAERGLALLLIRAAPAGQYVGEADLRPQRQPGTHRRMGHVAFDDEGGVAVSASCWPSQRIASLVAGKSPEPEHADQPVTLVDAVEHEVGQAASNGTSGTRMRSVSSAGSTGAGATVRWPLLLDRRRLRGGGQRDDALRPEDQSGDEGEQGQALRSPDRPGPSAPRASGGAGRC